MLSFSFVCRLSKRKARVGPVSPHPAQSDDEYRRSQCGDEAATGRLIHDGGGVVAMLRNILLR